MALRGKWINNASSRRRDILCLSLTPAEKGQFVVLDLGGSKFKVLQVKVREGVGIRKGEVEMEEKTYAIPAELRTGRGTEVRGVGGKTWQGKVNLKNEWLSLCSY